MSSPPSSMEAVEDADDDRRGDPEHDDRDHRREVDRAERRDEPAEDAQVRLADVVEEALDPVEPDRVGQPHPGHQDVGEDQQEVDEREDLHEVLDRRDPVGEQDRSAETAHSGIYGLLAGSPAPSSSARRPMTLAELAVTLTLLGGLGL